MLFVFRSLCKNLDSIKSNLKINIVNPNLTSIFGNPWIFEIPVNFKPTFIDMNLLNTNLHLNDFIRDGRWNFNGIQQSLNELFNPANMNLGHIDFNSTNSWAWISSLKGKSIVSEVYSHLNKSSHDYFSWKGWTNLWKLNAPP